MGVYPGPRYENGAQGKRFVSIPVAGHRVVVRRVVSRGPDVVRIVCDCGWSRVSYDAVDLFFNDHLPSHRGGRIRGQGPSRKTF